MHPWRGVETGISSVGLAELGCRNILLSFDFFLDLGNSDFGLMY